MISKSAQETTPDQASLFRRTMHKVAKHGVLTLFIGAIVAGLAGCSLTGGGWIPSLSGNGKATFGINATLPEDFSQFNDITDIFAPGDLTYHDKNYLSPEFPNGVNAHAGPGLALFPITGEFVDFLLSLPAGVLPPELEALLEALPENIEGFAVAGGPCTFARGGNGGQPGFMVMIGFNSGQNGAQKGDGLITVIYPDTFDLDPSDPYSTLLITLYTWFELFGIVDFGLLDEAIYIHQGELGAGGNGGGNLYVDGSLIELGGSPIAMWVFGALAVGALGIWRLRRRTAAPVVS